YKVTKISLDGVSRLDISNLTSRLNSVAGQPFSQAGVTADRGAILYAYQSAGFPDAAFDWRMNPGPGPGEVTLQYLITEGKQRYVRDVLISGLHSTRYRLISRSVLLKPGDPLSWTEMGIMQSRLYDLGVFEKVDMAIQNPQGDTERKYLLYRLPAGHRYYVGLGLGAEGASIGGH